MDGVANRNESLERMKVKSGQIHFLGSDGDIQPVETYQNSLVQLRSDLARSSRRPKLGWTFASERADHDVS